MRLPTTSYPHAYSNNRHGGSTGVKSHFLLPIPEWVVKTCHCTHHTMHYSATDHPRGGIRRVPYPAIPGTRPYPLTLDPASTNRRSRMQGLHDTGLRVFSPSHPLRHYGVQGWPVILGACRYSSLHSVRQNFTSKAPRRPCLLLPYKRAGRGLYEGGEGE
jgi:hypothetical protein